MSTLQNKIDFAVILRVKNANPNGDPLNSNRPRTNYENFGEITDVCIKRKIRDRLVERFVNLGGKEGKVEAKGQAVFVRLMTVELMMLRASEIGLITLSNPWAKYLGLTKR